MIRELLTQESLVKSAKKVVPPFKWVTGAAALLVLAGQLAEWYKSPGKVIALACVLMVFAVAFIALQWISKLKPEKATSIAVFSAWSVIALLVAGMVLISASAVTDSPWHFKTAINLLITKLSGSQADTKVTPWKKTLRLRDFEKAMSKVAGGSPDPHVWDEHGDKITGTTSVSGVGYYHLIARCSAPHPIKHCKLTFGGGSLTFSKCDGTADGLKIRAFPGESEMLSKKPNPRDGECFFTIDERPQDSNRRLKRDLPAFSQPGNFLNEPASVITVEIRLADPWTDTSVTAEIGTIEIEETPD